MIRSNIISGGGVALNTGEYVKASQSTSTSGTISNNEYVTQNEYTANIIGVDGYSTVSINTSQNIRVVGFNDVTDATELTVSTNVPIDISSYKYLLAYTGGLFTFTFA